MQGKTVVITGGTSGIGEVAALELARRGARIVLVARDRERADAMLARLRDSNGGVSHTAHLADLSLIADVKRVGAAIAAAEPRIDVLINNAGALFAQRETTAEGLERTFALNHMSYFVLTGALLAQIKATPGARILSTSSDAHRAARLDLDDLQAERGYKGFLAYSNSKLCNILFTRELVRRSGVTAVSFHPGFVATRFADNNKGRLGTIFAILKKLFAISPARGAEPLLLLARSPDLAGRNGGYWHRCKPAQPSAAARDDADAHRLWEISEKLAHG